MPRRRDRGENPDNVLDELGKNETSIPLGDMTASDFADAGYGSSIGHDDAFAKLGRNREKIRMTLIDSIIPNPTQPRRAIPSSLRQYWSGLSDEDSMAHFFQQWLEEVNLERKLISEDFFPIDAYLSGDQTPRVASIDKEDELDVINSQQVGPKEQSLLKIVELAASIRRDGLINPISIAQNDRLWEIETGERRWLAYQLLNWRLGGNDWEKIPARQVEAVDIWRQSTENNRRADLNAIAKARQFALLLMALRKENSDDTFLTFDNFAHEQDFYAQVSDGNQYSVPYGKGEVLINAMGISSVGQLRHLRRLLRLPQIVWTVADDLDWSENFIQKNIISTDDTQTIRNGIQQALKDGFPSEILDDYQDLLSHSEPKNRPNKKTSFADIQGSTLVKLDKQFSKLNKAEKQKAIAYLEDWLDSLKSTI